MTLTKVNDLINNNYNAVIISITVLMAILVIAWTILSTITERNGFIARVHEFWTTDALYLILAELFTWLGIKARDFVWNFYGTIGHFTVSLAGFTGHILVTTIRSLTVVTLTERN